MYDCLCQAAFCRDKSMYNSNWSVLMKRVAGYRCTICGKEYPFGPELMTCPSCGDKGILDIVYDYSEVKSVFSKETLKKDHDNSMWRYRALMPILGELRVFAVKLYAFTAFSGVFMLQANTGSSLFSYTFWISLRSIFSMPIFTE